ncbi:beta-ketoacyl synthase N-terminal-like domain-containing protein [Streptomyces sp. GD-15H]|uniref:type I polyketide synthase n=1 Tax=Streptomyces sp. GD-15H TaxID=3129112 RepID=UPI00325476A9
MDHKRALLLKLLASVQQAAVPGNEFEGIAVIGLAGRYPGAATPEELWHNVLQGRHCISEVPSDRWPAEEHYHPDGADGRSYSKWGGWLQDVDKFDPLLFQISPSDAEEMDPQERVFLETVWATAEDAGYAPRGLADAGPVGVFAGVMNNDYEWLAGQADAFGVRTNARAPHWSISNRVSYALDLRGPSLTVDTACSASLTAIHLACESLRQGECRMALAGGVNLILHPEHLGMLADRRMISRGDRCRSFGAFADGFVDGEGVGAVLLKPLRAAEADGDRIYAVLKGSAINSDGRTSGYTVPSPRAQAEVIRAALRRSGVDPRTVTYVEAHGTGTPLGDPIEIAGLREGLLGGTPADARPECAIGSVKSNIGHLESAAGIAGLAKVLMQLRHGVLPPSLHSAQLNPDIDLSGTPFRVQQEAAPWPRPVLRDDDGQEREFPRRAGISSFGGGGANAHLIVEEYRGSRPPPRRAAAGNWSCSPLSARDDCAPTPGDWPTSWTAARSAARPSRTAPAWPPRCYGRDRRTWIRTPRLRTTAAHPPNSPCSAKGWVWSRRFPVPRRCAAWCPAGNQHPPWPTSPTPCVWAASSLTSGSPSRRGTSPRCARCCGPWPAKRRPTWS